MMAALDTWSLVETRRKRLCQTFLDIKLPNQLLAFDKRLPRSLGTVSLLDIILPR